MRKRPRLEAPKDEFDPKDRISQLPDDILISILSRMTLKEAAITGILSKRWQHLWAHATVFDFDASDSLDKIAANTKSRNSERSKYINWVNRVFRKHRRGTLDALRIYFDLDKTSKSAIDNWVQLAITKGVRRLELELLEYGESIREPTRNYTFPFKYLDNCLKKLSLMKNVGLYNDSKLLKVSTGLECLQSLALKCANVCDKALDFLLSHCLGLHSLSIHGSKDLLNVKIDGSSLMLRHLEIIYCMDVESIEISNVNLVSFSYLGPEIKLNISNVPMLDEISIGEGFFGLKNNVFDQLSCCIYQLEVLVLDIYRPEENMTIPALPKLPKLKQLILKLGAWEDDSLLGFTSLVESCPNLRRFVLQLIWIVPSKSRIDMSEAPRCVHKSLKSVEVYGYYGRTSDAELVVHFLNNAVALEKIIIDPRNQILERIPPVVRLIEKEESARRHAVEQLRPKMPLGVKLILL